MDFSFNMLQVCEILGISVPPSRNNFNIPCPVCDEHGGGKHLNINLSKHVFCCPKCQEHGGMLDLYSLFTGKSTKDAYAEIQDRLTGCSGSPVEYKKYNTVPEVIETPLMDVQTRNRTYTAMLESLSLSQSHRDNLHARGLSDEAIERFGYKSCPIFGTALLARNLREAGYDLKGVPGFFKDDNDRWEFACRKRGILIPVRDANGLIQGLQIRLDDTSERKYRWISSRGLNDGTASETWCHVSGDIGEECPIITEGPLKADIVHEMLDRTVIAVPGVNSLAHLDEDVLPKLRCSGVTKVYIAFDMDYITNPHVKSGRDQLKEKLSKAGLDFVTYVWDPMYKGIDDYVTRKQRKE